MTESVLLDDASAGGMVVPADAQCPVNATLAWTATRATIRDNERPRAPIDLSLPGRFFADLTATASEADYLHLANTYGSASLPVRLTFTRPDASGVRRDFTLGPASGSRSCVVFRRGLFRTIVRRALRRRCSTMLPIPPHRLNMKADAVIKVRFNTAAEGGRQRPIEIAERPYGCPLFIDGEAFECRLLIHAQTLHLGETYELPVKFLNPDLVLPKLLPGKAVRLWEGKDIAVGEVVRLV